MLRCVIQQPNFTSLTLKCFSAESSVMPDFTRAQNVVLNKLLMWPVMRHSVSGQ